MTASVTEMMRFMLSILRSPWPYTSLDANGRFQLFSGVLSAIGKLESLHFDSVWELCARFRRIFRFVRLTILTYGRSTVAFSNQPMNSCYQDWSVSGLRVFSAKTPATMRQRGLRSILRRLASFAVRCDYASGMRTCYKGI